MSKDKKQPALKRASGEMLWGRLRLVGERLIPREEMDHLSGQDWVTWLTEPNPDKFPPSLEHLKKYLEINLEELDLEEDQEQDQDLDQEQ